MVSNKYTPPWVVKKLVLFGLTIKNIPNNLKNAPPVPEVLEDKNDRQYAKYLSYIDICVGKRVKIV